MNFTADQLKNLSTQTGVPEVAVKNILNEIVRKIKQENPKISDDECINEAQNRLLITFRNISTSKAVPVSGIVLGVTEAYDTNDKLIKAAMLEYSKNPQKAIAEGVVREIVDANGQKAVVAIDKRQKYKTGTDNKNYGEPLQENILKNVCGIFKPEGGEIKWSNITLNNEKAKMEIAVGKYYDTQLINKTQEGASTYTFTGSSQTVFIPDPDKKLDVIKFIETAAKDVIVPYNECGQWADSHINDKASVAIVKCRVIRNQPIDNPKSTSKAVLSLHDFMSGIDKPITAWVPKTDEIDVSFGEYSLVYAIGRIQRQKKKLPQGGYSQELSDELSFNPLMGIIPIEVVQVEGNAQIAQNTPTVPGPKPVAPQTAAPTVQTAKPVSGKKINFD